MLCSLTSVFAQHTKLPLEGTMYSLSHNCSYPRQIGTLNIIKADSSGYVAYQTDSNKMSKHIEQLSSGDSLIILKKKIITPDSLVDMLFANGLLTPDLIIKAMNAESKWLDHKGDTIDQTSHFYPQKITLIYCHRQALSNKSVHYKYRHTRKVILFEIGVIFGYKSEKLEDAIASYGITMFQLCLKGNIKPSDRNLIGYLKNARIICLTYSGTQI